MNKFASRLRELREDNDLRQIDIANLLHVSQRLISNYEHADAEPDINSLIRLADFFKVSIDYLVGRTDTLIKK